MGKTVLVPKFGNKINFKKKKFLLPEEGFPVEQFVLSE